MFVIFEYRLFIIKFGVFIDNTIDIQIIMDPKTYFSYYGDGVSLNNFITNIMLDSLLYVFLKLLVIFH